MPLTFLFTKADPNKRLKRWLESLEIYSFTINYVPGPANIVADALSRLHEDEESVEVTMNDEDYNDLIIASIEMDDFHHLHDRS